MKKKKIEKRLASLAHEFSEHLKDGRANMNELAEEAEAIAKGCLNRHSNLEARLAHAASDGDLNGLRREVREELDSLRKELEEVDLRKTLFNLRRDTAAHTKVVDDLTFQVAGLVRLVEVLLHHTAETGVSPNAKIRAARRESLLEEVEKAKQKTLELFQDKSATAEAKKVPQPEDAATGREFLKRAAEVAKTHLSRDELLLQHLTKAVPHFSRERTRQLMAEAMEEVEVPEQEKLFPSEEDET